MPYVSATSCWRRLFVLSSAVIIESNTLAMVLTNTGECTTADRRRGVKVPVKIPWKWRVFFWLHSRFASKFTALPNTPRRCSPVSGVVFSEPPGGTPSRVVQTASKRRRKYSALATGFCAILRWFSSSSRGTVKQALGSPSQSPVCMFLS